MELVFLHLNLRLDAKVPEDSDMRGQFGPRTKDTVDKANQLLDDFSSMLIKSVELK